MPKARRIISIVDRLTFQVDSFLAESPECSDVVNAAYKLGQRSMQASCMRAAGDWLNANPNTRSLLGDVLRRVLVRNLSSSRKGRVIDDGQADA